jgi:ketosteroid isomerase-like protein
MFEMREISTTTERLLIAVLLLIEACACTPKPEAEAGTVRTEILAIENQWATAIERQDAAAFERLAGEDFRFIDEDGVLNRAQYIAARSHNPEKVESAVQDQIEVRQYGNAAIATGRSIVHGTREGMSFVYRFRWTDVYVRRQGRWQAVSGQLTALSSKAE